MKKSTLLKLALMSVCAFLFVGAQAQDPAVINVNYTNVAETVYQTAGKNFRLYVAPDQVYSPGYDGDGIPAINALSEWRWVTGASYAAGVQVKTWANENWIEVAAPVAGTTQYWVSERYNALCNDATGTTKTVTVIAAPDATITTGDLAAGCGNVVAQVVAIQITEAAPATLAAYAFSVEEVVENIDAAGNPIGLPLSTNATFVDYPVAGGKLKTPALTGANPTYGVNFTTSALDILNAKRTRYTYTLTKASDAPGLASDGIISAISQKSDVVGGTVLTHGFAGDIAYVAIVNPTPTTGPIYHVTNIFAY